MAKKSSPKKSDMPKAVKLTEAEIIERCKKRPWQPNRPRVQKTSI